MHVFIFIGLRKQIISVRCINLVARKFGCVIWNMTRNDAINRLNNSELSNKNFGTNEKPIDVIKEGAF